MSDIMNHGRTDLVELPADCEADYYGKLIQSSPLACSPYLTLPIRSEQQARSDLDEQAIKGAAINKYDELRSGEVGEHRIASANIAVQFVRALKPLGKPLAYQPWQGVWLDDLKKQISIKIDFSYEHMDVDLKATLRMPSDPSPSHLRQQGLYMGARQKPAVLLYATPKKFQFYPLSRCEAVKGAMELLTAFEMIERWETVCPTPERAMRYLPLNADSFYWSDPSDVERASAMWSAA